ncbi:MAG: hypothetical protein GY828_00805, partial [Candidatus Gracilibacteria bacterium]|nr:hypothetical protein [Candidatus Gracilibacteria bacterium]
MSLDTFIPSESPESGGNAAEIAEKLKDAIKRGSAGIKRTQKDEKKAKKYDVLLAGFLVKIIIDKNYTSIHDSLFGALSKGFSSNLLLGILSLVHDELYQKIRVFTQKPYEEFTFSYHELTEFDDSSIDSKIKERINFWVEDISDIITYEYSNVQIHELKKHILSDRELITQFISHVFILFLKGINVTISQNQSFSISDFILNEVE